MRKDLGFGEIIQYLEYQDSIYIGKIETHTQEKVQRDRERTFVFKTKEIPKNKYEVPRRSQF